jgi:hypothetical protein
MAISRSQLLKELLPGLNALFGMEYKRYGEQHKEIYETESSDRSLKKRPSYLASALHLLKLKALPSLMTMHRKHGLLATTTRQSRWASPLRKKLLKITCMTACLPATRSL